ncbi:MAG TPA: NAD(P)-binding domain-containing protein [Hyphomicrobiaceae bacterium]|nr:NAD(P)-binding domain-containing protein [Hyphomicrobiaceae bacterium]
MTVDKLLVIGAGPVGLGMASALKTHGIAYHHVDANSGLGGNWHTGVYQSVHIVSSKRTTAYRDYPMPADYPDFPSARQMLDYLTAFARDKGIADGIEYNKRIASARPQPDDTWQIVFEDGEERRYKGLVVCNGHHWDKRMPHFEGSFDGEIMHSKDYQTPEQLRGRRVLVIGAGNSGCDVASEAARVGTSCDLSLRGGYWFLPKTAFGRPLTDIPIWNLPIPVQRLILKLFIRIFIGDYRKYGLKRPSHKIFDRHPTFGTDLLGYLRQGRIKPRSEIARLDGHSARFTDGTTGDYDLIVAATGFDYSFPFLPEGLIRVENDVVQVYGGAFPEDVKNLYIVGASQPRGGFGHVLTPAADVYAQLIKLQDELDHPIGAILKWMDEKIPDSQFMDPGQTLRQLFVARRMMWYVKWQGERMARKEPRQRPQAQSPGTNATTTGSKSGNSPQLAA